MMNAAMTGINGIWWGVQALLLYDQTQNLKNKFQETLNKEDATYIDYIIIAGKTMTITLDILSLKKDWDSSKLDGMNLDKNKISSAKLQATALAAKIATNLLEKDHVLDAEVIIRLLGVCRRTGQGIHSPTMNYTPTGLELGIGVILAQKMIREAFSDWYQRKQLTAAGVEYELDYIGIPDQHHDNPVFSQFICPISLEPIRFPVTAPNKTGGPDHHFERAKILNWIRTKETNPLTNLPLEVSELRENDDMRKIIEAEMTRLGLPLN